MRKITVMPAISCASVHDAPVLALWAAHELGRGGAGLTEMMRGHTFVGMADATLALVQGGTRLFLLDATALSRDLFYQQALRPGTLACLR